MKKCEFRSIAIKDIPTMNELLISRQNFECQPFPFLKNSCLNAKFITDILVELFVVSKGIGIGAFVNDELVGYIMGELKFDNMRGRHAWVPYEGIAIRVDQSSELIRNLYAKVSVMWLEQGYFNHYTLIPLGNKFYYEAFQRLSFFIEQVHGAMNIDDYIPFEKVSDAEIRTANKMDNEIMGNMSNLISSHQNSAPTFAPAFPERIMAIKDGYKRLVEDDDATIFFAVKDMKVLGFQEYEPCDHELMTPDNGVELCIAGTYPSNMGSGVGKRLMNEGYLIMKEKGYHTMTIDWRIANLTSSTFWPKCGFKPVAYRMVRCIDNNISWANFNNPSIKGL